MIVRIDRNCCMGHGRCYSLAGEVFEADAEGYGHPSGDGSVPPGLEDRARLAAANCPEGAVKILGEGPDA